MNEDQIKSIVAKYIQLGIDRAPAFDKFRRAQWKAIIEWQDHLESLEERFGSPLPPEWANVVESVMGAIERERAAIRLADQIEQTQWNP